MGFIDLLLIGIGLSMDAFAVALCKGLAMPRLNLKQAAIIALFFGGFQALMPVLGWALGTQFAVLVSSVSHWIAFALLVFIGGKMLRDVLCGCEQTDQDEFHLDLKELLMLALATSIDALAVGVTFAFLQVDIVFAASLVGMTTFVLSFGAVVLGRIFGARFERPAQIIGGIVLIAMGVKILLEGLGVL